MENYLDRIFFFGTKNPENFASDFHTNLVSPPELYHFQA